MDKSNIKKFNAEIVGIGFRWIGHSGTGCLNLFLFFESSGGYCCFDIDKYDTLSGFFKIFSGERDINYEDGFFAESLKGKHVYAWFDEDGRGILIGISSILDEDGEEMVLLPTDNPKMEFGLKGKERRMCDTNQR